MEVLRLAYHKNKFGLPKIQIGREKIRAPSKPRTESRVETPFWIKPEFHANVAFWRFLLAGPLKNGQCKLVAPLYCPYLEPHHRTLVCDASGDSVGGFCVETGAFLRREVNTSDFPSGRGTRLR